jgi:hypothetical protein
MALRRRQLVTPYHLAWVAPFVALGMFGSRTRVTILMLMLFAGVSGLVVLAGGDFYSQFRLGALFLPLWFLLLMQGTRIAVLRMRWHTVALVALLER